MNTQRIIVLGFALVAAGGAAFLVRGMLGGGTPSRSSQSRARNRDERSSCRQHQSHAGPGAHRRTGALGEVAVFESVDPSFITHAAAGTEEAARQGHGRARADPAGPADHHDRDRAWRCVRLHGRDLERRHARRLDLRSPTDSGAGGFILPNDRVDVILTRKPQGGSGRGFAKTILTNLRVLAVDQTFKQEKDTRTVVGKTATVEVSPEQAEADCRRRHVRASSRWRFVP